VWSHGLRENWSDGWLPVNTPGFDPGGPHHVAHDVIDHITNSVKFKAELMAFGVTLYSRCQSIDSFGQSEHSAGDLAAFYRQQTGPIEKPLARWYKLRLDANAERRINKFMESVRYKLPYTANKETLGRIEVFVRLGYKMAQRRYGTTRGVELADFWQELRNKIARNHDARPPPQIGDKLTVTFDTKTFHSTFKRHNLKEHNDLKYLLAGHDPWPDPGQDYYSKFFTSNDIMILL
jgi:hypothetical protein